MSIGLRKKLLSLIFAFTTLLNSQASISAESIPEFLTPPLEAIPDEALKKPVYRHKLSLNREVKNEFEPIKFETLFYQAHIEANNYYPIHLDTQFDKPIEIGIEQVIEEAVLNNLDYQIAKLDSKIAKWEFWEKFSDNLPDFSFNFVDRTLDGTFFINSGFQAPIDESIASRGFRFDYRAFNGGTTLFLTVAERYFRKAAQEQEEEVYNFTLYESARLYNLLLNSQLQVSSKSKALESAKLNLNLSEKFYKAGTGTKLDLMQAEAQVANRHKELIDSEADFRIAEIELANHIKYPLASILKAHDDDITVYNLVSEDLEMEEFVSQAKTNNPQIKRNLSLKKAAFNQGLSKIGNFLPKLDLFAEQTGNGAELGDLATVDTYGFNFSLEVGQNMGVGNFSDFMKSRNEVKRARLALEQEERRIETELRTAYIRFQQAKSAIIASEKEMLASKEALRLSKLRYQNGLEIFNDLTQKESEYFESQSKYINNVTLYNVAQARIIYLMGNINITDILSQNLET
ncbi:MAG: TolC family protein [Candidatus Caenarcaniphilales bacterium]|nr:TolC family protein [Candidatus Caenarcaniphilales bacterium]